MVAKDAPRLQLKRKDLPLDEVTTNRVQRSAKPRMVLAEVIISSY